MDNISRTCKVSHSCKKRRKIDYDSLRLYSLCAIPLLWIFIFHYIPMGGLVIAFKDYQFGKGIFGSAWVGLKNFEVFVKTKDFLNITWNTLSLNFIFIVAGTIAALVVAILLYNLHSRTSTKIFQTMMITPYFLSWVVVAYMAYAVLHPQNGFLNVILSGFGIEKIDWYAKPKAWPVILTIASVWKSMGIDSVVYYAALMGIDSTLYEAAEVDGASKWQQTKSITIPSLTSLIVILTILKIGNIFRADFGLFYQITRNVGALYSTTDVMDTYIFRTMRVLGNMGVASAAGLMQSVVGFVLVMLTNHISKRVDPEYGLF